MPILQSVAGMIRRQSAGRHRIDEHPRGTARATVRAIGSRVARDESEETQPLTIPTIYRGELCERAVPL